MTTVSCSGQTFLVQLETALHRLVESFWEEPYRYFTEADAVVGLQSWVARRPELAQTLRTADGFETGLLHREYQITNKLVIRTQKGDKIFRHFQG